jgi:NAD(P)H dehydrogenase (quinone)
MSIVVTGANGEFGRGVVRSLAGRGADVIASVREMKAERDPALESVEFRQADFDDRTATEAAFAGAETVFVNASFFGQDPSRRLPRVMTAIDAARAAGAERLVVTSWPDLEGTTMAAVRDYREIEERARDAAPSALVLRLAVGLADALARDVAWAMRDGALVAPAGSAVTTPAAVEDLAEGAARAVLRGDEGVLELRANRSIDWNDLARLAGEIAGSPIEYRAVDDAAYRDHLGELGMPPAAADALLEFYRAFRDGWAAEPDATLATLLEREPVDPGEVIRARLSR